MISSKNGIALLGAIALAVLFSLAGNLGYDALLAALVGARPGTVSFIAAEPNGMFVHRAAALASFGFLGFALGAALVGCGRAGRAGVGPVRGYGWLAFIAGGSAALCFAVLRARATALMGGVSDIGIGVALPLEDVPLYPLGVFPGLCVLAYAAVLLKRDASR